MNLFIQAGSIIALTNTLVRFSGKLSKQNLVFIRKTSYANLAADTIYTLLQKALRHFQLIDYLEASNQKEKQIIYNPIKLTSV